MVSRMRVGRAGALLLAAVVALGCRGDQRVDFGGRDLGPDRFSGVSTDGKLRVALTDEFLYFALSEETLEEARAEMREDLAGEDAGRLGRFIERTVGTALSFRARLPLDAIEDIRWEDGEMAIIFKPGRGADADKLFGADDEPITEAFGEDVVTALGEEFRAVRREQGGG